MMTNYYKTGVKGFAWPTIIHMLGPSNVKVTRNEMWHIPGINPTCPHQCIHRPFTTSLYIWLVISRLNRTAEVPKIAESNRKPMSAEKSRSVYRFLKVGHAAYVLSRCLGSQRSAFATHTSCRCIFTFVLRQYFLIYSFIQKHASNAWKPHICTW